MANPSHFTPRLILAGAALFGMLLALGVHILGQRFGFNLGDLWVTENGNTISASAAVAWWLISAVAFVVGYITAILLHRAVSGQIPRRLQQMLIGGGLLLLIAAGQAASASSPIPTVTGLLTSTAALALGALMAFSGAYFALERA